MTNELAIGQGLPQSKAEIEVYNASVKELALSGEIELISMARSIKVMEKIVKQFNDDKDIQDALVTEVSKYAKGELKEIQTRDFGRFDFSECNHPQYNRLCEKIAELTEEKKSFETYLKTLKNTINFIDPETGEQVEINPPVKYGSEKVVFTIK
jgi:RNA processing factor Prp31